mmetsp:Transcript_88340/g.258209  ORF Transcript_88340/g.258209 Transcript_88340/m.258209 type:complete len:231 (-) Transcript_88340:420-1112(-)
MEVAGRYVVPKPQDARPLYMVGDAPDVVARLISACVPVVVVSALDPCPALRRGLSEWRLLPPLAAALAAGRGVVVLRQAALALGCHVLRLVPVQVTSAFGLVGEDSDVMPRRRMPVGVVVALLWALEAVALPRVVVSARVLARGSGAHAPSQVPVCGVEALVALALPAIKVEVQGLVLTKGRLAGLGLGRGLLLPARSVLGASLGAITNARVVALTRVLQDELADDVGVP